MPNTSLSSNNQFFVDFATNRMEVRQAQALRYQVFSEEMEAQLNTSVPKYDVDSYDPYCYHLLVRRQDTGQVVGCTRILTSEQAKVAGGFYSESEFDLSQILQLPGRFMEVGRTCVHADYRNSAIMILLWAGLARFMIENQCDYMIGCASVPLPDDKYHNVFTQLQERHAAPLPLRVIPKVPLTKEANSYELSIPSLLKAYLRLGAKICGEPCWDSNFKVADIFIFVSKDYLQQRYVKHFLNRVQPVVHQMAA
jgi:putative hemolysin